MENTMEKLKYFYSSFIITVIGFGFALYYGSWEALYIVFLLSILEVSLSFDNAVVNAKVLSTLEKKWQDRFITWGIPIAVFGMRFVFPIIIVSVVGSLGIIETFWIAVDEPNRYKEILESSEYMIFAFGGSFLLMVFLDFFFDEEKEVKWIKLVEDNGVVNRFSTIANTELIIAMAVGITLTYFTPEGYDSTSISLAYFTGVLLHSILKATDDLFSTGSVKNGLAGLIYLEVLDASFSFDGVIGAFALSNDIFIIMIGLGVGAMFVRSLTIYFVEQKTLSKFIYLEHGAHYAIGALAMIMLAKIFVHIGEAVTGTVGLLLIIVAFIHSIYEKKRR
jgi:hypothetical protein